MFLGRVSSTCEITALSPQFLQMDQVLSRGSALSYQFQGFRENRSTCGLNEVCSQAGICIWDQHTPMSQYEEVSSGGLADFLKAICPSLPIAKAH